MCFVFLPVNVKKPLLTSIEYRLDFKTIYQRQDITCYHSVAVHAVDINSCVEFLQTPPIFNASIGHFTWTFPSDLFSPDSSPSRIIAPPQSRHPSAVKAQIWKLALIRIPDPNWPDPWPWVLTLTDPRGGEFFLKTGIKPYSWPWPTCNNFVHVNSRSLYIGEWRWWNWKGQFGNVLHYVKREEELSGRRKCLGEYVQRKRPDPKDAHACNKCMYNMYIIDNFWSNKQYL